MKKALLLLLLPLFGFSQVQIGSDIDGEKNGEQLGTSVSLSADGSTLAIGATHSHNGNRYYSGDVRIYKNISGNWSQIGSDIEGAANDDKSGRSVSLSADGSIVAIGSQNGNNDTGHVRVYKNMSGTWSQIGSDINGNRSYGWFGNSVSLSADGNILAIGAPANYGSAFQSGHVRIYKNISGIWSQIGVGIDGEAAEDWFGYSVSLSSDGNIVAIGAPFNDSNGIRSGHVCIYKNVSGTWSKIGSNIDGEAAGDQLGRSVSLSADGSTVAVGAPYNNNGNSDDSGHVRVYKNISGNWSQIGSNIDGEAADDDSGWSVSLSADGNTVAIGAPRNYGSTHESGHVRIYKNMSGNWSQIGSDIDGEGFIDQSGSSISLSADGNTVAIGSTYNNDSSGHVRVYDVSQVLGVDEVPALSLFNVYINRATKMLTVKLKDEQQKQSLSIYNELGQVLKTTQHKNISISDLSAGCYIVKVRTSQAEASKKIIIH